MVARNDRRAFTMVEALVAVAVGIVVVGAALMLFIHGNRSFTTTTEHASFREEAFLCLERIAKDMTQIVVSSGRKPSGTYHLVEPYELGQQYKQTVLDPVTKKPVEYTTAGRLIRLWIYHHTEIAGGKPVVVGQRVEWETRPVDPSRPDGGVNLYRNGEKINPPGVFRSALPTFCA